MQKDWVAIAKSLALCKNIRSVCSEGCGTDDSQIISHNNKGYSRYCFRCGAKAFVPKGMQKMTVRRREQEYAMATLDSVEPLKLPSDYTIDVPKNAAAWYFRYGITPELAVKYKFGYSPYFHRVVIPVYEDGELTAMTMRAVDNVEPKYLNPKGPKVSNALFITRGNPDSPPVIVEDVLSAIKVSRAGYTGIAILGTNFTDARALKIAHKFPNGVYIWLDGDRAGLRGTNQAEKKLELLGVPTIRIRTDDDPKSYRSEEIQETLCSRRLND